MASVFDTLVAGVKEDVAAREAIVPFQDIKARSRQCDPPRDAMAALLKPGCSVIAELKRADTDGRAIADISSPQYLAREFEAGGADIVACHSDHRNFRGSLEEMDEVKHSVSVPVMCSDFIVDPYQIHEARCFGADMLPLRVAILGYDRLSALIDRVESLGMAALVEVRTPEEATLAVKAGAHIIGVNARDFDTMELDREIFGQIAPGLPSEIIKVALSGVRSGRDLINYASVGADAVVVGESLVTAASPRLSTRALVAAGQHPSCPSRD